MSKMSRNKGAAGEREILRWFEQQFGLDRLCRNHSQSDGGGADCLEIPLIALEVKRQEQLNVEAWWQQAVKQALAENQMPVLAYRQNRRKWQFCIPASLITPDSWGYLTLTDAEFVRWFHNQLMTEGN